MTTKIISAGMRLPGGSGGAMGWWSSCGGPMKFCGRQGHVEAVPEKQRPPLDLTESMASGKPRWQFV